LSLICCKEKTIDGMRGCAGVRGRD
jgi:hypothetical protein